ncbi:MAG: spermine synthase [Anaerolineales bacterium]|nr:MAG: spermine synthase [Anaerolineales bacterium]
MKTNRAYLLLIVFVSGMTSLAAELSASRLLEPYFGTSIIIWANLIGLVLIYLTVGYYIGGRWADRHPYESVLYQITAWAGFTIGLVPFVAKPILRWSVLGFANYSLGILMGSLFGVILLFAFPITLLGCVSPFAIRLAMRDVDSAGNIAGSIYALSTLGSIVGTFTPVLVLIPNIGTRNTFLSFSLVLLVLSLIGLARVGGRRALLYVLMLVILLALIFFVPAGAIKASAGLIYETESAYNYIQVLRRGDDINLHLNEGMGLHSVYNPHQVLTYGIWDFFLMVPYFNDPPYTADRVDSLCMIGSAAGTIPKQYTAVYGPISIDGAEIDPRIVAVGRQFFAMNEPNFNVITQDGRYFLSHSQKKYDVVATDAYRPPYIPFHLTTREYFIEMRDHLTEEGVAVINVGRTHTDYSLVDVLASTMKDVFPSVYIIDTPDYGSDLGNSLVVGTVKPTRLSSFEANVALMDHPLLLDVAQRTLGHIREVEKSTVVFTDDKAPVEQMVHGLILRYALTAGSP